MQDLFAWAETNNSRKAPLPVSASTANPPPPELPIPPCDTRPKTIAEPVIPPNEKRLSSFRDLPPPPQGWVEEDFCLTAPPGMNMLPSIPMPDIEPDLDLPPLAPELVIEEAPALGM